MKKQKQIIMGILIVVFILMILVIVFSAVMYNELEDNQETNTEVEREGEEDLNENDMIVDDENDTDLETDNITKNNNTNDEVNNVENTVSNEIDYNNSDYIFEYEDETGEARYDQSQLDNFEFNIEIPTEIESYINNTNDFYTTVKEYIYLHGLVSAENAIFERYETDEESNRIAILYKLDNEKETEILVIVDLSNNTTTVYKY